MCWLREGGHVVIPQGVLVRVDALVVFISCMSRKVLYMLLFSSDSYFSHADSAITGFPSFPRPRKDSATQEDEFHCRQTVSSPSSPPAGHVRLLTWIRAFSSSCVLILYKWVLEQSVSSKESASEEQWSHIFSSECLFLIRSALWV